MESARYMQLTEEEVRRIAIETVNLLGSRANPTLVRKVVREVITRLQEQASNGHSSSSNSPAGD